MLTDPTTTVLPAPVMTRVLDGPRVRVLRAALPPYDDECGDYRAVLPGQVGLDLSDPAPLRLAPSRTPLNQVDDDDAVRRTATDELPAAPAAARVLALGMLEVLAGTRPLVQLTRSTSETVYTQLGRAVRPTGCPPQRAGRSAAVRAPGIRSVHVSHPTDGVAEVVAVVERRHRVSVLAFRMEGVHGRWRCTELVVG